MPYSPVAGHHTGSKLLLSDDSRQQSVYQRAGNQLLQSAWNKKQFEHLFQRMDQFDLPVRIA